MKSKQMCQFPTNISEKEGATVAATPTFSQRAASLFGPDGQTETSPNYWERLIKYHKCPTFDTKRDFQTSDWPSKTDDSNETNKMQMSLRTD